VETFINSVNQCSNSTKLQTVLCMMSIWKHRVVGKLVFKFQKLSGVSGTPCMNNCQNHILVGQQMTV